MELSLHDFTLGNYLKKEIENNNEEEIKYILNFVLKDGKEEKSIIKYIIVSDYSVCEYKFYDNSVADYSNWDTVIKTDKTYTSEEINTYNDYLFDLNENTIKYDLLGYYIYKNEIQLNIEILTLFLEVGFDILSSTEKYTYMTVYGHRSEDNSSQWMNLDILSSKKFLNEYDIYKTLFKHSDWSLPYDFKESYINAFFYNNPSKFPIHVEKKTLSLMIKNNFTPYGNIDKFLNYVKIHRLYGCRITQEYDFDYILEHYPEKMHYFKYTNSVLSGKLYFNFATSLDKYNMLLKLGLNMDDINLKYINREVKQNIILNKFKYLKLNEVIDIIFEYM